MRACGNRDDLLYGTDGPNLLDGGDGDDRLFGRGGNDHLKGGEHSDWIDAGPGDDTIDAYDNPYPFDHPTHFGSDVHVGGSGVDTITYGGRYFSATTEISLDGSPNDGLPGEHDNVRADIENVIGSEGNDRIIGSARGNVLRGGPARPVTADGDDQIFSGGGNDILIGGTSRDKLHGGAGDDVIWANDRWADTIDGGAGFDRAEIDDKDAVLGIERFL